MKTKINVTGAKIKKARDLCKTHPTEYWPSVCCPVALAVQSRVRPKVDVTVGVWSMHINNKKIPLPNFIQEFIDEFDSGKSVKPTSFSVDIPKKYLKQQG